MPQIERIISRGQLVQLTFMQDALAASQTDVQLTIAEVTGPAAIANDAYVMPFAGEIVAVSADLSAAGSAGSLTVGPTINGTECADPTLSITTAQTAYDVCPRGTNQFAAGARIGAEITTAAGWNGTTADLAVSVFVLLYVDGI